MFIYDFLNSDALYTQSEIVGSTLNRLELREIHITFCNLGQLRTVWGFIPLDQGHLEVNQANCIADNLD